jgi:transcriptional regulator with GAF, ATPase, and Fis domain
METATLSSGAHADARGVLCRLVVVFGAPLGSGVVVVEASPIVLGRDAALATLAIDDHRVSRRHAVVARDAESGRVTITDLGSRNGVLVDGARRERAELHDGAVIRVGKSLLVFAEQETDGLGITRAEAPPLFGPSPAMGRVRGEIERAAKTALPVLVLGETGVGKELAASALHAASGRKGAFVPVNCAAIAAGVAEAELFGHEAGAFTGAPGRREGLFAAADGGTLFLDEIGELPLDVQPKLLRALAQGEVRPVGSTRPRRVDVRVVAATHKDLAAAERAGTFRGDLLARLEGFTLRLPPLRERREDVLPLATRLLRGRPGSPQLSADAAEALLLHAFPHNVRELEHELSAALARWDGHGLLGPQHFSAALRARPAEAPRERDATVIAVPPGGRPSREDLLATLTRCGGNIARAASHYGRDRHQIYRWAQHHGIELSSLREG